MLALLAAAPALPLGEGGKYVAGAYIVFVLLLVVYVGIMATKLQRIERDLRDLASFAEDRKAEQEPDTQTATPVDAGRETANHE